MFTHVTLFSLYISVVAFSFVWRCVTVWPSAGVNHRGRDLKNKTRLEVQTSKYNDVGLQEGGGGPEEEGGALTASSSRSIRGDERKTAANVVAHLQILQQWTPIKTHNVGLPGLSRRCVIYKLVCSYHAHSGTLKNITSAPLRVRVIVLIWKKKACPHFDGPPK